MWRGCWLSSSVAVAALCCFCLACAKDSHTCLDRHATVPTWLRTEGGFHDTLPEGAALGYLVAIRQNRPEWVYYYLPSEERAHTTIEEFCEDWAGKMEWYPAEPTIHAVVPSGDRGATVVTTCYVFGEGYITISRIDLSMVKEAQCWKVQGLTWGGEIPVTVPDDWASRLGLDKIWNAAPGSR